MPREFLLVQDRWSGKPRRYSARALSQYRLYFVLIQAQAQRHKVGKRCHSAKDIQPLCAAEPVEPYAGSGSTLKECRCRARFSISMAGSRWV